MSLNDTDRASATPANVTPRGDTRFVKPQPAPDPAVVGALSEHIPIPDMLDETLLLCLICFDDAYDGADVDFVWPRTPVREAVGDPRLTPATLAWLADLNDPGISRLVRRHPNCPERLAAKIGPDR